MRDAHQLGCDNIFCRKHDLTRNLYRNIDFAIYLLITYLSTIQVLFIDFF